MGLPNFVTDRPAAVIGIVRAALILVAAFWPGFFTMEQREAIIALAIASIALSGLTITTTVPKTPSPDAPPAAIQQPPA